MSSKKKPDRSPHNKIRQFEYKIDPSTRRVHSPMSYIQQIIRQNHLPAPSDLADLLEGELRTKNSLVPDEVRIAIQDALRGKKHRGKKVVTIKSYLKYYRNPIYDFEKVLREHENRGEKVRVGQLMNAVRNSGAPITESQFKTLLSRSRKVQRSSSAKKSDKSSR